MKPFNKNSLAIGISNYRRPDALKKTLLSWLNSGISNTVPIYVLSNVQNNDVDKIIRSVKDCWDNNIYHIVDYTRQQGHWGCLAQSWNTLIQMCLKNHEWIILSQDDVNIESGWIELLEKNPFYLYQGNVGDQVVCFGRELFNFIPHRGWYDERIRMVGVHDFEFLRRVIRTVGLRNVCIESVSDGMINPIGLFDKWQMVDRDAGRGPRKLLQQARERGCVTEVIQDELLDNSQVTLIMKGANGTKPYVDEMLDYVFKKWGTPIGEDVDTKYKIYKNTRFLKRSTLLNNIPTTFLNDYGVRGVYDIKEDFYYVENAICPRNWKEGKQLIDDIDWHPYFKLGKLNNG